MRFNLLKEANENEFDKVFQCYKYEKFKRPSISKIDNTDDWFRYLKNDLHNWFKDNKIQYSLHFDPLAPIGESRWLIEISKVEHAILYKLTWK